MSAAPLKSFLKLLVLDPKASATFYETLGFTRVGTDGTFIHLRWQDSGDLLLVATPTRVHIDARRGYGVLICFASETGLDVLAERAAALNAPTQGPEVQPWHTRDLIITDPDGYRLNFVQPA
ncbi:MAG: VOC family protein [Myxococcus sp.]|nr:VOC family protein [Myxococcus sp.]